VTAPASQDANGADPVDDPVIARKTLAGGGFHPELPGVTLGAGLTEIERTLSMAPGVWRVADAELRSVLEHARAATDDLRRAFDERVRAAQQALQDRLDAKLRESQD
jgi:hypothetical protein